MADPSFSSAGDLGALMSQILQMISSKGFGTTTPYQNNIMQQQQQMFTNPLGSGIFQGLVGSVLNALKPQEAQAQQNLTDMFRSAGGASPLQSGAFAKQAQMLQGNILGQESNAISGLAQNSMGQLQNALTSGFNMGSVNQQAPMNAVGELLKLLTGGVGVSAAQAGAQNANTAALQASLKGMAGGTSAAQTGGTSPGQIPTSGGTTSTNLLQQIMAALNPTGNFNPNPGPGLNSYGYPLDTYGGSGAYYDPTGGASFWQQFMTPQNSDMGGGY